MTSSHLYYLIILLSYYLITLLPYYLTLLPYYLITLLPNPHLNQRGVALKGVVGINPHCS